MDTRTARVDVTALINEIKAYMPETYASIQAKAKDVGNVAYEWVRRGLRGEANCFYAFERGRVVGTPFSESDVTRETAYFMVTFGCAHVCMWASQQSGGVGRGAH
jgi:hypothetical protein